MKYCKKCGAGIEDDLQFCTMCGTKYEESTYTPTPPPAYTPPAYTSPSYTPPVTGGMGVVPKTKQFIDLVLMSIAIVIVAIFVPLLNIPTLFGMEEVSLADMIKEVSQYMKHGVPLPDEAIIGFLPYVLVIIPAFIMFIGALAKSKVVSIIFSVFGIIACILVALLMILGIMELSGIGFDGEMLEILGIGFWISAILYLVSFILSLTK